MKSKGKQKESEVKKFYNLVAHGYEQKSRSPNRFCDKVLEHFIFKFLPAKKLRVLDVGGGIGRFAFPLARKDHEVVLSDISESMLAEAKKIAAKNKISNISFIKESATSLKNHAGNSFDAALAMNAILDYCGNYKKTISEIYRVLKKNGVFIGNANNLFMYAIKWEILDGDFKKFRHSMKTGDRFISWLVKGKGHYSHEFTAKELEKALKTAGFKSIKLLGVFNLLDKYLDSNPAWTDNPIKMKEFLKLQEKYALDKDYLNNSNDFFFIAKK